MPQKPTVLIVDDEANVLAAIRLVLEQEYEVSCAGTGWPGGRAWRRAGVTC
ncbi:MAG: hypothetical protein HY737_08580 [Candidatus Omnitrophica bacterium]|nr:hypothetical protein [Candidatus Omnitrophota bacterium]